MAKPPAASGSAATPGKNSSHRNFYEGRGGGIDETNELESALQGLRESFRVLRETQSTRPPRTPRADRAKEASSTATAELEQEVVTLRAKLSGALGLLAEQESCIASCEEALRKQEEASCPWTPS